MVHKTIKIKDLIDFLDDNLISVFGEVGEKTIDNLADAEHVDSGTLDWINTRKSNKQYLAETSKATCVLVDKTVEYTEAIKLQGKILIVVENPRSSMADVAWHFFVNKKEVGVHRSATIHPKAEIALSCSIGAGCVIGKATIGPNTVLMPNVVVYDDVTIGANCLIQAGAVIGTDGLGCSRDKEGRLHKFPHLGGVVIGNDVEIGANCQIARGALSDTIIEDGCKMNGLCFISHNCHLEKNVWITGNTMLCGSVHVGKNTTIYSGVTVRDQRTIGMCATIGMGAIVTKDVPEGETWIGNPAKKLEK